MKKILSLALVSMMVASMAVSVSAKESYTAATGTATVDGKMDDCYLASTAIAVDTELEQSATEGFATATVYCAWDADNLYVYADIKDAVISTEQGDAPYMSDSVEVYVDMLNEEGNATADVNAGQYTAGYLYVDDNLKVTGDNWGGLGGHWNANHGNAVAVFDVSKKDGYSVEMMIPWGSDFAAEVGSKIGFTFAINDDADNAAGREYQIFPEEGLSAAWSNTDNYGELTLSDVVYTAPVEEVPAEGGVDTTPVTADAGIVAAAAVMAMAAGVVLSKKH